MSFHLPTCANHPFNSNKPAVKRCGSSKVFGINLYIEIDSQCFNCMRRSFNSKESILILCYRKEFFAIGYYYAEAFGEFALNSNHEYSVENSV